MKIGRLGFYGMVDAMTAAESVALARRVERWGYGMMWVPEAFGCNPMVRATWLLAHTETLNVGTGIASIYARDALAALNAQHGLAELSGGRFLLGLGVSHAPLVEGMRGHVYEKPLPAMRAYLAEMAARTYGGPPPAEAPKTVIAALGPKMLEIAATLADGAHPYNVTPDHTAEARAILGPGKLLCPEQMVLLETAPDVARGIARDAVSRYLSFPNYRNSFLRMGYTAADFDGGGSDRLVDGLIAWGDEDAIRARIAQHWDAGADHVAVQVLPREGMRLTAVDEKILELLAPAGD